MIRERTARKYLLKLLREDRIINFINDNSDNGITGFFPFITIVDCVNSTSSNRWQCSGTAHSRHPEEPLIEIARWICVDKKEAFATIRHELAHCIQDYCCLPGSAHGRGFTQALKIVSPRLYRRDRHWSNSIEIEAARKAMKKLHGRGR